MNKPSGKTLSVSLAVVLLEGDDNGTDADTDTKSPRQCQGIYWLT